MLVHVQIKNVLVRTKREYDYFGNILEYEFAYFAFGSNVIEYKFVYFTFGTTVLEYEYEYAYLAILAIVLTYSSTNTIPWRFGPIYLSTSSIT